MFFHFSASLSRKIAVTDARGNTTRTSYDENGNVLTVTNAKGNIIKQTEYNELNLTKTVTDAVGKITEYTYNTIGKLIK